MKLISWNTPRKCHLHCRHCYRDAGETEAGELSTEEGKKLLGEIAESGFNIIIFSGGEPLLRDDILELTSHARGLGLRPVFGTTGTTITREMARRLKQSGAVRMGISLDSAGKDFHDELRQVPGSWHKAVEGMKNCRKEGLEFQVHTTVVEKNYDEFEQITDFSVELGAEAHHIFFLVPSGRALNMEREALRREKYEKLLQRILNKQKEVSLELKPTCAPQFMRITAQKGITTRFSRGCLAGTAYCCITPNGDVNPCPYLPVKVGNVLEIPFSRIWREGEVFNRLRNEKLGGKCGECRYLETCSGCRARAYYYEEDYMSQDPWCLYEPSTREGKPVGENR